MNKFRIGDFVSNGSIKGKVTMIMNDHYKVNGDCTINAVDTIPWVPQKDEYCWANIAGEAILTQWRGSLDKHQLIDSMDLLEPFIGILPAAYSE